MRLTALATAILLLAITPVRAEDDWEDGQDQLDAQLVLAAEMERARAAGGYSNPFSALAALFTGESKEGDVQPSMTDVTNVPADLLEKVD